MDAENTQSGFPSGNTAGNMGNTGFAGSMGSTGSSTDQNASGTGNTEGISGMARNFASQAQQKAGEQVRSSLDKGRTRAVDTLHDVARTLRQADEGGDNPTGRYMSKAGDQVERVAQFLQQTDYRQMVTQTEAFARRQPALFLGGAFAIGVIAARFLKSGRSNDTDTDGGYGLGEGRMYDRERSLSSFREPSGYTADSGFANDLVGDDSAWPNGNIGMEDNTRTTDFGSTNRP